jgi:hypothetical protein
MTTVLSFSSGTRVLFWVLVLLALPLALLPALPFSWDLLWAGSWEEGSNLTSRGDLKLRFTGPGLTLRGEILDRRKGEWAALWPSGESWEAGKTRFLGALYHQGTGSRVLYGTLEEWGLAARLRSPWSRTLPFTESRKASMADLRSAYSGREDELYLYLGSPYLNLPGLRPGGAGEEIPRLRVFASARLNPSRLAGEAGEPSYIVPLGRGTALSAGLEGRLGGLFSLSLEGFYSAGDIPVKNSSAWFLDSPPLPAQDFRIFGLGLLLNSPYVSLSADTAWSRTSIYGYGGDFPENLYAGLGIRAGNKGTRRGGSYWQLSLSADGAGPQYTGSDGAVPGAGFRTGGKFEWRGNRAGLFRLNTGLSGPGFTQNAEKDLDLHFDRSASGLYYRPPAWTFPLRISRVSLTANRDAREMDHIKDSAALGLSLAGSPRDIGRSLARSLARIRGTAPSEPAIPEGTLTLNLSGALSGTPKLRDGESPGDLPWPVPAGPYFFESLKAGAELSWSRPIDLPSGPARLMNGPGGKGPAARRVNVQIKAGFDYGVAEDREGGLTESRDLSISAALRGKLGRFGIKLGYPDFPADPFDSAVSFRDAWELSLSWRREWRQPGR